MSESIFKLEETDHKFRYGTSSVNKFYADGIRKKNIRRRLDKYQFPLVFVTQFITSHKTISTFFVRIEDLVSSTFNIETI